MNIKRQHPGIQMCYWKWEFLRRNPEYRKDYETYLANTGGQPEKPFRFSWAVWIKDKYGLCLESDRPVLSPDVSLTDVPPSQWPFRPRTGVEEIVSGWIDADNLEAHEILIRMDLRFKLLEMTQDLQELFDLRIKERELEDFREGFRRQTDRYAQYFESWDLRWIGLTEGQIAQKLQAPKSTIQSRLEEADRLIQGGYRELR